MPNRDQYDQWKAGRQQMTPPPDFAEQVMANIGEATRPPPPANLRQTIPQSLSILATVVAAVIFVARIAHMLSILWPVS